MSKLTVFYDNWCPNCTRFAATVNKLNWLNLIKTEELRNEDLIDTYSAIDMELATKQMASFTNKWQYGYNSIFSIFLRIPVLWIFIPLLFILKLTGLGQLLYMQLAIKRRIIPLHCTIDSCGPLN